MGCQRSAQLAPCSKSTYCWIRRQGHASCGLSSTMDMVMQIANTAAGRSVPLPATTIPKEAPDVEVVVHPCYSLLHIQEFAQKVPSTACRATQTESTLRGGLH